MNVGPRVVADNAEVRVAVEETAALLIANGAELHPALEVREADGQLSLHANTEAGETLVRLPQELLVPIDGVVWDSSNDRLSITRHDPSANPLQRRLTDLHVAIYNATNKIEWARRTLPPLAFYDDPIALRAVRRLQPRFAWQRPEVAEAFIGTRIFQHAPPTLGLEPADAEARSNYLMPIIDLLNHHVGGAPLGLRDGSMTVPVRHGTAGDECFAFYGSHGPVDQALGYGYVDTSVTSVASLPLSVEVAEFGSIGVGAFGASSGGYAEVRMEPGQLWLSHARLVNGDGSAAVGQLYLPIAAYLAWHSNDSGQVANVALKVFKALVAKNLARLKEAGSELSNSTVPVAAMVREAIVLQSSVLNRLLHDPTPTATMPERHGSEHRKDMHSRVASMSEPWLRAWEPVGGQLEPLLDGELALLFAQAHTRAARAARERLATQLPFALDQIDAPAPSVAYGMLAGPRLLRSDRVASLERAVYRAAMPGARPARLVHTDAGDGPQGNGIETSAPQVTASDPAKLMDQLDRGWMLEVPEPTRVDPALAQFVADLEAAFDAHANVVGWYGIGSALGPAPIASPHPRVVVQVLGERQVLVSQRTGEQTHLGLQPGMVLFVPPARLVHHLPRDIDTLHIEIELELPAPAETPGARAARRAAQPPTVAAELASARAVLAADPTIGHWFRWGAPGGLHVLSELDGDQGAVELVAGGKRLHVGRDGLNALAELAAGGWTRPAELVRAGDDGELTTAFVEDLWQAGLIEPAEVSTIDQGGERLTKVGHTPVFTEQRCGELISTGKLWRTPEPWELRIAAADSGRIEVCEMPSNLDDLRLLFQTVTLVNREIFQLVLTGLGDRDPLLLVRHRAGSGPRTLELADYQPDVDEREPGRKLTFAVPLDGTTDRGGRIRLAGGSDSMGAQPGQVSVFAAFRPWVLEPLDDGTHHTLIGRIHGPRFS